MILRKTYLLLTGSLMLLAWPGPIGGLSAAPSGGPYGPLQLAYEIPPEAKTVYYVAPDGNPEAEGTTLNRPTTLETAIAKVVTGDAIILRGGTYRTGNLIFNQGITLQPYRDEQPVLKGTRAATGWEALSGGLWRTKWDTLFPFPPASWWRLHRHIHDTPLYLFNNDMVFIDGRLLQTRGYPAELDENAYCIDYESGYVYLRTDPTDRLVEITAYDNAFTRTTDPVHGKRSDKRGFTMRGIVMTQYAYRAIEIEGYNPEQVSPESAHGKDVTGTMIEHCTMSYCSRVGAYLRGDNLVVRHCLVSDTGTEGLFILSSNDVLLEKNLITRNNEEGIQGYYATAIKIFNQCYRVTCNDNLVIDINNSSGIWYDVGNVDGVFTNNWIQNTTDGFFFEISKGVICAGNVFVNCVRGTRVLNSSGAKLHQNTYVNSGAAFERTPRSAVGDHFDWHPASGPDVDERHGHEFGNNLIVVHQDFPVALLSAWQTPELCDRLTEPMFDQVNHNVYVRTGSGALSEKEAGTVRYLSSFLPEAFFETKPVIGWSPFKNGICHGYFKTLDDFHQAESRFDQDSVYLTGYNGPLFQGKTLGNYELTDPFTQKFKVPPLPDYVLEVLPRSYRENEAPGAYPERDRNF